MSALAPVVRAFAAIAAASGALAFQSAPRSRAVPTSADEWPMHLHDAAGTRFSPLTQITPANVAELQVAWVYHMKPPAPPGGRVDTPPPANTPPPAGATPAGRGRGRGFGSATGFTQSEVTPLVVNGTLYLTTPYGRIVALDPTTGKEKWVFSQPLIAQDRRAASILAGDATHTPRLIYHGGGGLVELDPNTGEPIAGRH